ncbi:MAG: hypothetical protein PHY47_00595 [Lachnospiraceae bacterium]|nr:hypothetical protein [Lachnospiraceae bacterium]
MEANGIYTKFLNGKGLTDEEVLSLTEYLLKSYRLETAADCFRLEDISKAIEHLKLLEEITTNRIKDI